MAFEWHRMQNTPEGKLGRAQERGRESSSFDVVVNSYTKEVEGLLKSERGAVVMDELGRFGKKIAEAREGVELDELAERLFRALRNRKISLRDEGDTRREKAAFAMALSRAYIRSLQ